MHCITCLYLYYGDRKIGLNLKRVNHMTNLKIQYNRWVNIMNEKTGVRDDARRALSVSFKCGATYHHITMSLIRFQHISFGG